MQEQRYYEQAGVAVTSRSYSEYEKMFVLRTEQLAGKRVLDVSGGASSFTAEARKLGIFAEAADPMYAKTLSEIEHTGKLEIEVVAAKMEKLTNVYNWEYYGSVARHKAGREVALDLFLQDFGAPDASGRYHAAMLPELPFDHDSFELVLCSHFLFLYEEQFDYDFHLRALQELVRVCKPGGQVRIYPLLNFQTKEYSRMEDLMAEISQSGCIVQRNISELPFLPGSKFYLSIDKAPGC
ncbi:methyltransferase domain-containing protein [Paenibacillus hexagrammi]|uniref:Class I SAM-dependent methyltransferase n=1 Tax=Paenibacillus hexagrammi TaxID=2908839 RepID=A0ABY3SEK6_9BACL|nr:class I SAM-dependent methyltransferase [Paenibacillus sp. YPD9-1]UJF31621.1 class I SAM-dependent methyltransferase [Paenibacillus sp. YPD9-1]